MHQLHFAAGKCSNKHRLCGQMSDNGAKTRRWRGEARGLRVAGAGPAREALQAKRKRAKRVVHAERGARRVLWQ